MKLFYVQFCAIYMSILQYVQHLASIKLYHTIKTKMHTNFKSKLEKAIYIFLKNTFIKINEFKKKNLI